MFVFPWILKEEFSEDDLDSKSIEDIEYVYKFDLYLEQKMKKENDKFKEYDEMES